ncbi:MAG: ABC transporter substrate-binding protein/permease [Eubacterium sp.]|nr:ABC transporter substrate-binding protein/permease [Eubacterium sp.]
MINSGLKKVRQEGIYDELYEKYFSGEEEGGTEISAVSEQTGFLETLKFIFLEENRWKYYVNGLKITIIVSLLSMCVGMVIGLCVALIRLDADRKRKVTIVSGIMSAYVDVIRGTPSVLQLMIIYFALFHSRLGYVAAVVSFGINSGAYVSEVIRGGILAVDRGQMEAGRSLGLGYGDTMRFIIIPQAVKNILPAMGNEFIQLIKETSILGYVGIVDLTKASSYVSSRTYQMFIPLVAAGMMYYLIVKVLSVMLGKLERRLRESD